MLFQIISTLLALSQIVSPIAITQTNESGIEHSVIPFVEKAENITRLNQQKYAKNQFEEISRALKNQAERLRVVTFNLLCSELDSKQEEGHRWEKRLPRIVKAVREMAPDAIGVQEPSIEQINELLSDLGDTYAFYGPTGDNDECNGIFYRKDRLEQIDGKIWVIPVTNHNATMIHFKDRQTNQEFALFNTHLAFRSADNREIEIRFILEQMESQAKKMPVLLMGDLNTFPNRIDLDQLPFYDGDHIHRILTQSLLRDAEDISLLGHVGPISTFTNQPPSKAPFKGTGTPGVVLDHIYVSKEISVLIHATQPVTIDGGYPSDHMPVFIDFTIPNKFL